MARKKARYEEDVVELEEEVVQETRKRCKLNDEQLRVLDSLYDYPLTFVNGTWGCLGLGTKVMMYDGTFKEVQNVRPGDQLMGPDSKPRNVLSLCRGEEQMYWIHQSNGMSYRVNENHILSLKRVIPARYSKKTINGKRVLDKTKLLKEKEVNIENISVVDYLSSSNNFKIQTEGYVPERIDFPERQLEIDPYYFGLWLADGNTSDIKAITNTDVEIIEYLKTVDPELYNNKHSEITYRVTNENSGFNEKFKKIYNLTNISSLEEKYIPEDYIYNSYENRMKLVAGFIDGDGSYSNKCYDITIKHKKMAEQLTYILRTLGFRVYLRNKNATMKRKDGTVYRCLVYRLSFSAYKEIPCKIERKKYKNDRRIYKNPLHTEIFIEKDIVDNYYGFTLDGDHLFLLEDLTVTHNTGKTFSCIYAAVKLLKEKKVSKIVVTRPFIPDKGLGALPGSIEEKLTFEMQPILDNFHEILTHSEVEKMMKEGTIKLQYNGKIKGITVQNAVFICDETQDMDYVDFLQLLTRLGKDSKMICTLSVDQIHKSIGQDSCYYTLDCLREYNKVGWVDLVENHRHGIINDIVDYVKKAKGV